MILIFIIIPFLWLWLLDLKLNLKEKFLVGSTFFWVTVAPIILILNKYFGLLVTPKLFWFLVILVTIGLLIWRLKSKNKIKFSWPRINWNWSLIIILVIYGILHMVFYHFYVTMPESDGYDNLLTISEMMKTGVTSNHYRPLFFTAMTILGQVTKIDLYQIHVFWMIALSVVYLITISLLIDKNNIKNFWERLLSLSFGLAVPVINMEIDFFRPQNLCLLLFPVIFYLEQKNKNYLALFISVVSIGYHQFFIFPIIILGLKLFFNLKKSKRIWLLVIGLLLVIVLRDKFVSYLHVNRIFEEIWKIEKWRWWFLNKYETVPDNIEMGWPGIGGATKYYGYYFGPLIVFCLGFIVTNLKKLKNQKYWLLMILMLFLVCEVFPRLNVVYLPERFPLLIDLLVLLIMPFLFRSVKLKKWVWLILVMIGMMGSVYVAQMKGSLTTKEELKVAEWIKDNIPEQATILTQKVNKPMVTYFSQKKFLDPGKIFFEGDVFSGCYTDDTKKDMVIHKISECKQCYVMYSFAKLNKLSGERDYWSEYNYVGVNLEKFNSVFEKVYDKNGVTIWKI